MSAPPLQISVAILAGGLATRLGSLTEKIPKALLPIAGKPFLAHQLAWLRRQGITRAVLCVGHLGEMIQWEFEDGRDHGVKLDYSFDGSPLLGTGGALKKAMPLLGRQFFVLYGDSYLPIDYQPIAHFFQRSAKLGLMTVYRNENRFDTSNVWFADGAIKVYDKKIRLPEMQHIDYGLSLFQAAAFDSYPAGTKFDLADVMQQLVKKNQLAGFEVRERFYEIGSHTGLAELQALLASSPSQSGSGRAISDDTL